VVYRFAVDGSWIYRYLFIVLWIYNLVAVYLIGSLISLLGEIGSFIFGL